MPIPKDLLPFIGTLRELDPQRDSLNSEGNKTPRRTGWQNFWGYVIYILTLGLRAKNPALDLATGKVIRCAVQIFNQAEQLLLISEDQQAILDAMTKLKTIIELNQGSDGKKIAQLIAKIQGVKLETGLSTTAIQLTKQLTAYCKEITDERWVTPTPTDKLKAQEIVSLLPNLTDSPHFSTFTLQLHEEDLLHAIIHTDRDALKSIFLKIQPVVLTQIADMCLRVSKGSSIGSKALRVLVEALEALPDLGGIDFQVKVLNAVFAAGFKGAVKAQLLAKLQRFSLEVWKRAGQESKVLNDGFLSNLPKHIEPAAVIAYLNGLVNHNVSNVRKEQYISILLFRLIEKSKSGIVKFPFSNLSDDVIARLGPPFDDEDRLPHLDGVHDTWDDLLGIIHPENEEEKRFLERLSHPYLSKTERLCKYANQEWPYYPCVDYLRSLTIEQMKQLPWETYHKPIQLVLALLSGTLPMHAELVRGLVANFTAEETNHAIKLYCNLRCPQFGTFLAFLSSTNIEAVKQFVSKLKLDAYHSASADELLALPRDLLMDNFKNITKRPVKMQLLARLPDAEARLAFNTWWDDIAKEEIRELYRNAFPFARMFTIVEDPYKLKIIASAYYYAVQLIPNSVPFLRSVLDSFEKAPWKLMAVVDVVNVEMLRRWYGDADNPRTKFPKCFEIIDWYKDLSALIRKKKWKKAFTLVSKLDDNHKNYLLASVRGAAPEELATFASTLTDAQLFASLFDGQAQQNLQKAILATEQPVKAFSKLVVMVHSLQTKKPLPPHAQQHVNVFDSVGGYFCPLQQEFNQPRFSDLTLQLGQIQLLVHKAILSLDPFFQPLLQTAGNTLVIPQEKMAEADLRLKKLYGQLTLSEAITPEIRDFLRRTQQEASSLAPLDDGRYSDVTIVVEKEKIKAHKLILATAFEHFNSLFQSGMKESTMSEIELQDLHPEIVKSIVQMIYTGIEPELSNENTEEDPDAPPVTVAQLFRQTLDFLKPDPNSILPAAVAPVPRIEPQAR